MVKLSVKGLFILLLARLGHARAGIAVGLQPSAVAASCFRVSGQQASCL